MSQLMALIFVLLLMFRHLKKPCGQRVVLGPVQPELLLASVNASGVGLTAVAIPARSPARMNSVQAIRA